MSFGGFGFDERMAGHYTLATAPGAERPIDFTMSARATGLVSLNPLVTLTSVASFLREPRAELEGEANLVGFADHKPAHGTILLDLLLGRRIAYDFEFSGNDGQPYRFRGQKDISLGRLPQTMSTLPATLYDGAGVRIGEALVRFDYSRELLRFLRSFRLVF